MRFRIKDINKGLFASHLRTAYFFVTIIIIVSVAVLTIVSASIIRRYEHSQIKKAQQNAVHTVHEASLKIDNYLSTLNQITKNIAAIDSTLAAKPDHASKISDILQALLEDEPDFLNAYTAYEKGFFKGSDYMMIGWYSQAEALVPITQNLPGEPYYDPNEPIYKYHEDKSWYLPAKKEKIPLWGPPYFDEGGTNEIIVSSVCPIFDAEGRFIGVAGNDVPLNWLSDMVSDLRLLESGYVFIVSEDEMLMTFPQKDRIMENSISDILPNLDGASLKEKLLQADYEEIVLLSSKDPLSSEDVWVSYFPVDSSDWGVIGILKQNEVLVPILRQKIIAFIIVASGAILIGLFSWFVLYKFAKKIRGAEKERHAHETALLQKNEERFRQAMENIPDAVIIYDHNFIMRYANKAVLKLTGRPLSDFIGIRQEEVWSEKLHTIFTPPLERAVHEAAASSMEIDVDFPNIGLRSLVIRYVPLTVSDAKVQEVMAVFHDLTERKDAEEAKNEIRMMYEALIEQASEAFFVHDFEGKFIEVNQQACTSLGYTKEELLKMSVMDVEQDFDLKSAQTEWSKIRPGMNFTLYRHQKRKDSTVFPVEVRFGVSIWKSKKLFLVLAHNITERKQAEEEIEKNLLTIKRTFEQTIATLGNLIDIKDPYTSGHQKKVANLSVALAKDLGLSEEKIEAVKLAALIHDIGKISIPASILSKPGQLSDIERALVETHSKIGYEILKEIDFPYPIAKIILSHHEKLDGSGYPNGLKNGEITLEARILAVCDIFDAMTSHRPYRAALSLETTIDELVHNKGKLYDTSVVECLIRYVSAHYQ